MTRKTLFFTALFVLALAARGPIAAQADIVINGSFEDPNIPFHSFGIFASITGWSKVVPTGPGIEIQDHVAGDPFHLDQFLELNSTGTSGIFQDLATVAGQTYDLSFAFSPRPTVKDNQLNVMWNGGLVAHLTADGTGNANTVWTVFHYSVTATGATTRLQLDDFGEKSDSLGSYVDAVSVTAVPEPVFCQMAALLGLGGLGLLRLRRRG